MAKSSVLDEFTFEHEATPCSLSKAVDEAGLREGFDHAVDQILDHRRKKGARSASGPNASWLADKLADKGLRFDTQVVRKHVAGKCSCYRGTA